MTVSNTNRFVQYTGNGLTTVFPYNFIIPDTDSAVVQLLEIATNTITVLTPSQYSITGINNASGGEVTYPLTGTPLAATHRIQILRVTNPVQEVSVNNQSAYNAGVVEGVWDRLTLMAQDNADDLNRALKAPFGQTGPVLFTGVAGTVPMYDASGNLVQGPSGDQISSAQSFANAADASANAAAISATGADNTLREFETKWLGPKAADPTLDNEGNPLIIGAAYWNTTTSRLRIWDGANWSDAVAGALLQSNNLSDLLNTGTARTNLGVAVGTDVQAQDSTLQSFADNAPYALGGITVLTSGGGATYNTPSGVRALEVLCQGGGGGGGGVVGTGTGIALGGGGQGGSTGRLLIEAPGPSYTYSVGAGGAGGVAGGDGSTGGSTTFTDGGSINLVVPGGEAGEGMTGTSGFATATGGGADNPGSGGDFNFSGAPGNGVVINSNVSFGNSSGGDSFLGGGGGHPVSTPNNGLNYGGGGSGATRLFVAGNRTGGNGASGVIIIKEYY